MRTSYAPTQSDEPEKAPGRPDAQSPGRRRSGRIQGPPHGRQRRAGSWLRVKPSAGKWIVGFLAAVLALSTIAGVVAQEEPPVPEPPKPETANVEVTVWRSISDPSRLYVSTRPEGGRWRTLNTALDMSAENSGFHQSNAVRVRVPLEGGGTANVDVTVWRRISNPSRLYVSTRPEGGRWRTLNTALDMSAENSGFHQSNAVLVKVTLPGPPPYICVEASAHTPLHAAVEAADARLVRTIVAACPHYLDLVSSNYFDDQTPLSLAIGGRDSGIVQILVNAGADPDKRVNADFRVGTHLTYAIGLFEYEIAQILLDADADPNVVDTEQFYDQTPLSLVIADGNEGLLDGLLAAGADPNKRVNPAFRVGTHLTYAVGLGDVNVVQKLLDAGADANVVDTEQFHDQTPLSLAIKSGDEDMLGRLIAAGADPDKRVSPDFRVGTHLTYAVGLGDTGVVQILLDAGADPDVIDREQFYDESPLSLAVKDRDADMVRILLNAGADPNRKLDQFNDVSPIDIATEEGYTEILQILLAGAESPGGSQGIDSGVPDAPSDTSTTSTTSTGGDCQVNLVVSPGESCVYPGTSAEFSVDAAGSGHFLFFTSGTSISLQDATVNGVRYDFAASKQADGTWLITAVGS